MQRELETTDPIIDPSGIEVPSHYELVFAKEEIDSAIDQSAKQWLESRTGEDLERYKEKPHVFLGLLLGCRPFVRRFLKMLRKLEFNDFKVRYLKVETYGDRRSNPEVKIKSRIPGIVKDADTTILDDVADTESTVQGVLQAVREKGPRSLEVRVMVNKSGAMKIGRVADHCALDYPGDQWLVGRGMNDANIDPNNPNFGRDFQNVYATPPEVT